MIHNGKHLITSKAIVGMTTEKHRHNGVSHGLSEVGYDLRTKQKIEYFPPDPLIMKRMLDIADDGILTESYIDSQIEKAFFGYTRVWEEDGTCTETIGKTALASSIEQFDLPLNLWGELRNKSTWARQFVDATIGTDMEPGWKGFLTIEVIFHGIKPITIPAGSGIAKAVFHELREFAEYTGKYQNQPDKPVGSIFEN